MPATLTEDRLGIECVFSDGSTARFELDGLPCPELAGDLLAGLVELIHPHGTVDAAGSVTHYTQSIRDMTRKLAARGFTGGAAELRRAQMAEYWMAASGPKEACTRRMLHGLPLTVLVDSLNGEARLSALGLDLTRRRLVALLADRLRLREFQRRHPEVLDQPVTVAAAICGLPRTGSTLLHRLLGSSPQLTATPCLGDVVPAALPRRAGRGAGAQAPVPASGWQRSARCPPISGTSTRWCGTGRRRT